MTSCESLQAQLRAVLIDMGIVRVMLDEVARGAVKSSGATTACALTVCTLLGMGGVDEVVRAGGVQPLVDLAVSEKNGYLEALNALELLALSEVARNLLVTETVVSALMSVSKFKNVAALSSLTIILCALTNITEQRSFLLQMNIVPTLGLLRSKTGVSPAVLACLLAAPFHASAATGGVQAWMRWLLLLSASCLVTVHPTSSC